MLNVNIGGYKGFKKFSEKIKSEWKTFDIEPRADYVYDINSREPFPFLDDQVDNYYASMIFEHVMPSNIKYVFSEIYRTLKSDGKIRIVVPDIEIGIRAYIGKKLVWLSSGECPTPDEDYPPTELGKLMGWFYTGNQFKKGAMRQGHCMVYDWVTLRYYLQNFKNVSRK
jgi:predicted SAM-dependent methyltransferase